MSGAARPRASRGARDESSAPETGCARPTSRVLPTERVDCPSCGSARFAPELDRAPAQLVDLDQTFEFARCADCELVYLKDRVPPEHVSALYANDYPLHEGPALWGPFAPLVARDFERVDAARVRRLLAARALGPDDVALDVGCGRPTFLAALRRATGCRAFGVDAVEPDAGDARFAGLEVFRAMPPEWPAALDAAAPFSAVTMWHYLEHDPAPVDTLRWIAERVRTDGVLVAEVPDYRGSTARLLGRRWPGLHTPRHASVFTAETLRRTAERAGWRVASHERSGTLAPYTLVALGALDAVGFRFGRHAAPLAFPFWAAGMAATWPWLGRASREGRGLQTVVLRKA